MRALEIVAASLASDLRNGLQPWAFMSTRRELMDNARMILADAIAEDETGVTRLESRSLNTASRSDLTPEFIERVKRFRFACVAAHRDICQLDYVGLLTKCEGLSGERRPVAA